MQIDDSVVYEGLMSLSGLREGIDNMNSRFDLLVSTRDDRFARAGERVGRLEDLVKDNHQELRQDIKELSDSRPANGWKQQGKRYGGFAVILGIIELLVHFAS